MLIANSVYNRGVYILSFYFYFTQDSEMRSFLSGISIAWDSLKLASNEEHKQADITRLFWEASTQRLVVRHLTYMILYSLIL